MKLLLDSCVWGGAKEILVAEGHDVEWVGHRSEDPGDKAILRDAYDYAQILITLDKDFGDLAVLWGAPHHGIIRLVNIPAQQQGRIVHQVVLLHGQELFLGAIVTVDSKRIRIRPPEQNDE